MKASCSIFSMCAPGRSMSAACWKRAQMGAVLPGNMPSGTSITHRGASTKSSSGNRGISAAMTSAPPWPSMRTQRLPMEAAGKLPSASTSSSPWPISAMILSSSGVRMGEIPLSIAYPSFPVMRRGGRPRRASLERGCPMRGKKGFPPPEQPAARKKPRPNQWIRS